MQGTTAHRGQLGVRVCSRKPLYLILNTRSQRTKTSNLADPTSARGLEKFLTDNNDKTRLNVCRVFTFTAGQPALLPSRRAG